MNEVSFHLQMLIDIIQTVRVSCSISIKKRIHVRPTTWVQQIMGAHIVQKGFEHGAVEIGIQQIPYLQGEGLIAVNGNACGQKLIGVSFDSAKNQRPASLLHR